MASGAGTWRVTLFRCISILDRLVDTPYIYFHDQDHYYSILEVFPIQINHAGDLYKVVTITS